MPKERNFNPVQAQRKADKKKDIKKGKAEHQARRNEKLAQRNPERMQKQIDDLKKITTSGGKLTKHEEAVLEGLEREHKSVLKAREALGDKAPTFSTWHDRDADGRGVLGKRRRDDNDSSDDCDVPEDVRSIPMPRDTPPPIQREVMDGWYARRRARWQARQQARGEEEQDGNNQTGGDGQGGGTTRPKKSSPVPPVESRAVYESAPQVRNLRKEAVTAFVPAAVRMKLEKGKGQAGLLEPEEADRLEKEGYLNATTVPAQSRPPGSKQVTVEDVDDDEE